MKRNYIILILLFLIPQTQCISQVFTIYGDKSIGTGNDDILTRVIRTPDGQLLFAGSTRANINGDKTDPKCDPTAFLDEDVWIVKTDTNFNIQWDKGFGGNFLEKEVVIQYDDFSNSYLIGANSASDSSCDKSKDNLSSNGQDGDYWFLSVDTTGNLLSEQTWRALKSERSPKFTRLKSGNMILSISSNSPAGIDKTQPNYNSTLGTSDIWIIKTDNTGNKLWDRVYGSTNNEQTIFNTSSSLISACSIVLVPDKNNDSFLMGCITSGIPNGDVTDSAKGGTADIWIIKIDSLGNKLWDRRLGGPGFEAPYTIRSTNDNGYILVSDGSLIGGDVTDSSNGFVDLWVLKLDSLGNKQWDNMYGGNKEDWAISIDNAIDGGYLLCGFSSSDASGDVSENKYTNSISGFDYWILKIDSVGNKIWDKRFGGPNRNACTGFLQMPDTSIYIYGISEQGNSPVKTDFGHGGYDYWAVHFKYTDTTSTVGLIDPIAFDESVSLYPNPASDFVTIASNKTQIQNITMYNLLGELIETKNYTSSHNIQFDLQTYPKGVYIAKIKGQQSTVARKVVKN
jgi:hypothetical protein